jgi:aliphatic nitrilase
VAKACSLIEEAARPRRRARRVPGDLHSRLPLWSAVAAPIHNHEWFARLAAAAPRCPGPELERISAAARAGHGGRRLDGIQ